MPDAARIAASTHSAHAKLAQSAIAPSASAPAIVPTPPNVRSKPIVTPSIPGGDISAKNTVPAGLPSPSPIPSRTPDSSSCHKLPAHTKAPIPRHSSAIAGRIGVFRPKRSDRYPDAIVVKNCGKCVTLIHNPSSSGPNPFCRPYSGITLNRAPCRFATIISANSPTNINAGLNISRLIAPRPCPCPPPRRPDHAARRLSAAAAAASSRHRDSGSDSIITPSDAAISAACAYSGARSPHPFARYPPSSGPSVCPARMLNSCKLNSRPRVSGVASSRR